MANTFYALDYNNTPPQIAAGCAVTCRPFNFIVNSAGSNVTTLGSGDILRCCTLPGQGCGIVITDWFLNSGIIDSGTHAVVLELGLILIAQDAGATNVAAAGFFMTTFTPGSTGGIMSSNALALSGVMPIPGASQVATVPYSIGLQPNNNGGLYDLALQVTTPAGTVAATAVPLAGYVKYFSVSQPWSN